MSQVEEDDPRIDRVRVARISLHPDYNFTKRFFGNDLAVLRLERMVKVKDTVIPACFPLSQEEEKILTEPGHTFWTAGHGAFGASISPGGENIIYNWSKLKYFEFFKREKVFFPRFLWLMPEALKK